MRISSGEKSKSEELGVGRHGRSDRDGAEPTKKGLFGRRAKKAKDPSKPGRMAQVRQVFTMTRKADPAAVWWMLLAALAVLVVAVLIGIWIDQVVYTLVLGIPLAILAATIILGRRAEKAAFAQIEGPAPPLR